MNAYLDVAISQQIEKGRMLNALIPRNLPRAVDVLVDTCKRLSSERIKQLRAIGGDTGQACCESESVRLREFRRISKELDIVEKVGVMTLNRWCSDDTFVNRLTYSLAVEIQYPLTTPVVKLSHP